MTFTLSILLILYGITFIAIGIQRYLENKDKS